VLLPVLLAFLSSGVAASDDMVSVLSNLLLGPNGNRKTPMDAIQMSYPGATTPTFDVFAFSFALIAGTEPCRVVSCRSGGGRRPHFDHARRHVLLSSIRSRYSERGDAAGL
jgi:hypothetical protein